MISDQIRDLVRDLCDQHKTSSEDVLCTLIGSLPKRDVEQVFSFARHWSVLLDHAEEKNDLPMSPECRHLFILRKVFWTRLQELKKEEDRDPCEKG